MEKLFLCLKAEKNITPSPHFLIVLFFFCLILIIKYSRRNKGGMKAGRVVK